MNQMNLTLPFLEVDKRNKNGRIYPKEVVLKAIEKYNNKKIHLGEFIKNEDYYQNSCLVEINLEHVSHIINKIYIDDKGVCQAEIEILNTPIVQQLIENISNSDIIASPRGFGSLSDDNIVQEDYELIAIDLILMENNEETK